MIVVLCSGSPFTELGVCPQGNAKALLVELFQLLSFGVLLFDFILLFLGVPFGRGYLLPCLAMGDPYLWWCVLLLQALLFLD